ncbi:carboxylesterase [Moraxella caviae]|uniref:Carboxylesterase n=1 Tax=Moraxella caviae TaxID=34060 RepID=A0A1S9ZWK3_9GAMM|nr:carboxylesterase [Moraxella caviae]OOR87858.1 carboxylesterase [Moraxella caviae]STZ14892.1 Carboxylesterase 2 [Moraxella caviae]VEW11199.1 Carboxylesterase 2 [Moraxella caviae]
MQNQQDNALLNCEIVEHNPTGAKIDKAVIWLHGLGASGHDFVPVVPELELGDLAVRFVFPHAPKIPVTINGGYIMPAWYDILEMTLDRKVDVAHIAKSSEQINALIDAQIAQGVPSENIIIAGFSQGGAVAYHTVLTNTRKLAGLLALSTYFATAGEIAQAKNTKIAVKIDHGDYDDIVPCVLGKRAKQTLTELGFAPEFSTYPMAHQVCLQQIKSIGAWIKTVYGA